MDLISDFYGGRRYFGVWSSPQRSGHQYPVYSKEDVVRYLRMWNGVMNCGISVCTFKGEVPFLLYLPFDFDAGTREKPRKEATRLYNYLVDEGWDVMINDSGYRGYHCLVSVEPNYYTRGQIKSAHEFYKRNLKLDTLDTQIFGDIRRLIRIPGTTHAGKFKKVKGKGWQRQGEGGYCYTIKYSKGDMLNLDDYFEDEYPDYDFDTPSRNNGVIRKCIGVMKAMDNKEPSQLIRYSHTVYLLKNGYNPDEVLDMYEARHGDGAEFEWDDWDKEYTMKQISHIAGGLDHYNQLMCETVKAMGYCDSKCPLLNLNLEWFKKSGDLK